MGVYVPTGGGGSGGAPPSIVQGMTSPYNQSGAGAFSGASQAKLFLVPYLTGKITVGGMVLGIGTQSGNFDVGIYSLAAPATTLNRIASSGSVPCPAGNNNLFVPFTAGATLDPTIASYYLALACDNITATFFTAGGSANLASSPIIGGMTYRFTGAFPLPPTLTIASAVAQDSYMCLAAR